MFDIRRREFIMLLGGAAVGWPLAARAQQPGKMARIGFLGSATAAGSAESVEALRAGLRDFGHVEGRNIVIEFRWAEGKYDRLSDLVAELIRLNVDLIVTHGTPGTRTAKQATTTIPIVMAISGDAIATGIVRSLAQPEANLTGSTFFLPELNAKRLELLKEACPQVARVAALSNPDNPVSKPIIPAMQTAATPLKLEIDAAKAQGPSEFDSAFAAMVKSRVDAVVVTEDGEFAASFGTIAALSAANKLASIGSPEYARAGGLIGYGVNLPGLYRRAAYFIDRILKGAKPADLPIEQPTKFELVVNFKTAKALGLDVPATVLARRGDRMKRRAFITLLGGTAATWPLAARAQQPERMRRIGVLMSTAITNPEAQARLAAFQQGLQQLGWIVCRNVQLSALPGRVDPVGIAPIVCAEPL